MENTKSIPLKPYTTQQLAQLYCISFPTFKKWIRPFADLIGERQGHFFSVKQVAIIFENLGRPDSDE
jgi:hypothetical protein